MAAYAALVSLMTTLNNIQIHPRVSTFFDHKQTRSLHQITNFLLHFIETSNSQGGSRDEEEALESRIASTAYAAEDVIESHVVDQLLAGSTALLDLVTQIEDANSVKETVMELRWKMKFVDQQSSSSMLTASSKPTTTKKEFMVGFDEKLIQIMDRLTGYQPDLQIVPIVGMGRIGKTTLATSVYHNSLIVESFDIRAWVTISQEYTVKNVLSELLSCLVRVTNLGAEAHEIRLKLYQALPGRRYLIVLDDMWSLEAWDKIKFFLPDNSQRSRVVITTRIWSFATHLSLSSFEMNFLDEDQSWELFCVNVFLEKGCPPELEQIGKNIINECKGLPLSIVVIGRLLRNSSNTREYWENFARDLNSILISGNDEHCFNILSLSYNQLPGHLKPCFLYMGVFREDRKIRVSTLIKLFVSEGFLKPKEVQTLEEVAEDFLYDLVDRNLILADSWKCNGRMKYCKMHDLVREVCLKIGERERFSQRMTVRGIAFDARILEKENRLLRVLTCLELESLEDIPQLVNLRYVYWGWNFKNGHSKLPSSISLFWNVHTLISTINYKLMEAPSEIWNMRQLRHLQFNEIVLPDPPPSDSVEQQDDALLPNLQTISKLVNFSFTKEVCKRIPNIKKLCILYTNSVGEECQKKGYYYLGHLHKLQSLKWSIDGPKRGEFLQSLVFPSSLKKLSLLFCGLNGEDLNTFGLSLPHLEVLKLKMHALKGPEWDCVEGAFPRLKYLYIEFGGLVKWTAESSDCFPVLEKLHLHGLSKLERTPSCMGDIQTLRSLHVDMSSVSAAISSIEILEEQLSLGNDDLQLSGSFSNVPPEAEKSFWEEVEIKSFTNKNFKWAGSLVECCNNLVGFSTLV